MRQIFCTGHLEKKESGMDCDRLTILLDVHCWEHYGNKAFFGIYAKDDLDVDSVNFKVTEIKQIDTLNQDMRTKFEIYDEIYKKHDSQ